MTTLEIVLVSYIVLNWIAFVLLATTPRRHWKTIMFLTFVLNPIVSIYLAIYFSKVGNDKGENT